MHVGICRDDVRKKDAAMTDQIHMTLKENETLVLGVVGVGTVVLVICGMALLWTRPKFLYMPIYDAYDKDSEISPEDDDAFIFEAEMVEGGVEEGEGLLSD